MFTATKKLLLAAAILAGFSSTAFAVPFAVEGKLTAANDNQVTCNGTTITLVGDATAPNNTTPEATRPTTVYTTPTSTISRAQLLSPIAFPGQGPTGGYSAFIGGTCIIDGNSVGPVLYAETFFAEIAENVLVGPVTGGLNRATGVKTPFAIAGVPIVVLGDYSDDVNKSILDPYAQYEVMTDPVTNLPMYKRDEKGELVLVKDANGNPVAPPRIHAVAPTNQFGYEVNLSTVPLDDESSAEGHLIEGKFYAHVIETSEGDRKNQTVAEPSATVQRANGRARSATQFELEIRGSCEFKDATSPSMNVLIRVDNGANWVNPNAPTSTVGVTTTNATCVREIGNGGVYTYKRTYTKPAAYAAPTKVIVRVAAPVGTPLPYADNQPVTLTLR